MTDDAGPPPAEVIDVLVVEDSRVQSEALRLGLERRGYRVRVAADGAEGLVAVREQAPDLIITDIDMPNMDGYQMCEEIKNDSQLRSIPVILLTSLGEPEDIFRGLEVRADNYLTKPFDEEILDSRIEHVLANRQLRSRHRAKRGVEVIYSRRRRRIDSDREQILDLLMSSLDNAMHRYAHLESRVEELEAERRQLIEEVNRLRTPPDEIS